MQKLYYFIYVLTTKNNRLFYVGLTNNIQKRILQHKSKIFEGYTKKYNINKLVYYEVFEDILSAIKREKVLKRWSHQWKVNLIKEQNSNFKDLCDIRGVLVDFRFSNNFYIPQQVRDDKK